MRSSLFDRVLRPSTISFSRLAERADEASSIETDDDDLRLWFYGFGERGDGDADLTDFDRGVIPPEMRLDTPVEWLNDYFGTQLTEAAGPSKSDINDFNKGKGALQQHQIDFWMSIYSQTVAKGKYMSPKQAEWYFRYLNKARQASQAAGGGVVLKKSQKLPAPNFKLSTFQAAIMDWAKAAAGKDEAALIIDAKAGSGKTKTIETVLHYLPEDQTVAFMAFNKDIAAVLEEKTQGIDRIVASTINSVGFAMTLAGLKSIGISPTVDEHKTREISRAIIGDDKDGITLYQKDLEKLVGKRKLMVSTGEEGELQIPSWDELAARFKVGPAAKKIKKKTKKLVAEPKRPWSFDEFKKLADQVWQKSLDTKSTIDFADQVFFPLFFNFPYAKKGGYKAPPPDWVMVDECQDLCPTERELVSRLGGARMILVGDPNQSIYAFKGADPDSMPKMKEKLGADQLPLSICYRCSKAVIKEAQSIVPEIEAAPWAVEGSVEWIEHEDLLNEQTGAKEGDFVLCRTTAPLLQECFAALARGMKATVKGKQIGASLANLIDTIRKKTKLKKDAPVADFIKKMKTWALDEQERLEASDKEEEGEGLKDKIDAIVVLMENSSTVEEAMDHIKRLFSDFNQKVDEKGEAVAMPWLTFSTIHKAKGLEADNVFIIRPDKMPHPMAETPLEKQQEENLKYVAITRAKKNLRWVIPPTSEKQESSQGGLFARVVGEERAARSGAVAVSMVKPANKLPGGKGDKLDPADVDPLELAKGVDIEMEHTKSKALATEIALDHLAEDPKYYTKLKKIHKD